MTLISDDVFAFWDRNALMALLRNNQSGAYWIYLHSKLRNEYEVSNCIMCFVENHQGADKNCLYLQKWEIIRIFHRYGGQIIRIINGCEVRVENSVTRVTVRNHEAYREVMNFQFAPKNHYRFFLLHTLPTGNCIWLRLLLVALPGLFCLPFWICVILSFSRKNTCNYIFE